MAAGHCSVRAVFGPAPRLPLSSCYCESRSPQISQESGGESWSEYRLPQYLLPSIDLPRLGSWRLAPQRFRAIQAPCALDTSATRSGRVVPSRETAVHTFRIYPEVGYLEGAGSALLILLTTSRVISVKHTQVQGIHHWKRASVHTVTPGHRQWCIDQTLQGSHQSLYVLRSKPGALVTSRFYKSDRFETS